MKLVPNAGRIKRLQISMRLTMKEGEGVGSGSESWGRSIYMGKASVK
jgi:hypothetical protein